MGFDSEHTTLSVLPHGVQTCHKNKKVFTLVYKRDGEGRVPNNSQAGTGGVVRAAIVVLFPVLALKKRVTFKSLLTESQTCHPGGCYTQAWMRCPSHTQTHTLGVLKKTHYEYSELLLVIQFNCGYLFPIVIRNVGTPTVLLFHWNFEV